MTQPSPPPVKIKLYGFLNLTRRGYYLLVAVWGGMLAAVMVYWMLSPKVVEVPPEALWGTKALLYVWIYLPWIVLAGLLLAGLEMWLVLRKFAAEEARRRTETKGSSR